MLFTKKILKTIQPLDAVLPSALCGSGRYSLASLPAQPLSLIFCRKTTTQNSVQGNVHKMLPGYNYQISKKSKENHSRTNRNMTITKTIYTLMRSRGYENLVQDDLR
jgi:hypothetical protein